MPYKMDEYEGLMKLNYYDKVTNPKAVWLWKRKISNEDWLRIAEFLNLNLDLSLVRVKFEELRKACRELSIRLHTQEDLDQKAAWEKKRNDFTSEMSRVTLNSKRYHYLQERIGELNEKILQFLR